MPKEIILNDYLNHKDNQRLLIMNRFDYIHDIKPINSNEMIELRNHLPSDYADYLVDNIVYQNVSSNTFLLSKQTFETVIIISETITLREILLAITHTKRLGVTYFVLRDDVRNVFNTFKDVDIKNNLIKNSYLIADTGVFKIVQVRK
jgi:hypothetical protein